MTPASLTDANRQLFERYARLVEKTDHDDRYANDPRLSLSNLAWMCREGMQADMPEDKSSRWLGFIQGCLAMRGLIDVDTERDISRPIFHSLTRGMPPPRTRERP